MDIQNSDAVKMCPKCNVPMVEGVCPSCGGTAEGSAPAGGDSAPAAPEAPQA